jgi:FkbM family methyltransferase
MSVKTTLINTLKSVSPNIYWKLKANQFKNACDEVETKLLPLLCKKNKTALDIGAAGGIYMVKMQHLSANVICFEPIQENINNLKTLINAVKANATIEGIALSDKSGVAKLKMIINDLGRSTIEEENILEDKNGSAETFLSVPIKKLDDYNYNNIGFIKIDVEGHELGVLMGAKETIKNNRPNLLVEIEDRHKKNALLNVPAFLQAFDYMAFFIENNELKLMKDFDQAIHQDANNIGDYTNGYLRKGVYINNFIFIPVEVVDGFILASKKLLN